MTLEEKLAYIFDPGQMAVDFVTGVVIGKAVGGIANKLPDAWFKKGFGKKSEIWDSQVRATKFFAYILRPISTISFFASASVG